jgi:hypothetical protein
MTMYMFASFVAAGGLACVGVVMYDVDAGQQHINAITGVIYRS